MVGCCWVVVVGWVGTISTFISYDTYETNSTCWFGGWRLVDGWLLLSCCCWLVVLAGWLVLVCVECIVIVSSMVRTDWVDG